MWLRIWHSIKYKFRIPRYDCTLAKSAIYFVIDTMEVCVYISQNYIIHKYKMKAFNIGHILIFIKQILQSINLPSSTYNVESNCIRFGA
jgi:hypothetical protein